jgi:hypothetical protein
MLDKIRFKKVWFVLLVLPLFFTPVRRGGTEFFPANYQHDSTEYLGLTVGPQLAFPISYSEKDERTACRVVRLGLNRSPWVTPPISSRLLFVDWGRIAYWEAWMLAICVVVNRKRLLAKETS